MKGRATMTSVTSVSRSSGSLRVPRPLPASAGCGISKPFFLSLTALADSHGPRTWAAVLPEVNIELE